MKRTPPSGQSNPRAQRTGLQEPQRVSRQREGPEPTPLKRRRAVSKPTAPDRRKLQPRSLGGAYQINEIAVDSQIVGDLGMEGRGEHVLMADSNDLRLVQTRWYHST
jgi:hypothetical protein